MPFLLLIYAMPLLSTYCCAIAYYVMPFLSTPCRFLPIRALSCRPTRPNFRRGLEDKDTFPGLRTSSDLGEKAKAEPEEEDRVYDWVNGEFKSRSGSEEDEYEEEGDEGEELSRIGEKWVDVARRRRENGGGGELRGWGEGEHEVESDGGGYLGKKRGKKGRGRGKKKRRLPNEKLRKQHEEEARHRVRGGGEGDESGEGVGGGLEGGSLSSGGSFHGPGGEVWGADDYGGKWGFGGRGEEVGLESVREEDLQGESEEEREERRVLEEDGLPPLQEESGGVWSEKERRLWEQPPSLGLKPCLRHSRTYRNHSTEALNRGRYLMAVVTGGLNQMRLQIGNAVVIARILRAVLVVPVLQENNIWHDRSEFSEIFDVPHFQRVLRSEVRVVTTLPPHYLRAAPDEKLPPTGSTPEWIISHLLPPLRRQHVLLIRGLDQAITPDLPRELQKLRCKVEFHALRFIPPILALGQKLVSRMAASGPFIALHLRLEPDVWIRTGCYPRLGPELDAAVVRERVGRPDLLTGRLNLTAEERFAAGLCPLTADVIVRLLKSFGATNRTRVFWAGAEPMGGAQLALAQLWMSFSAVHSKESLALPGELEVFARQANVLAALDFILCASSHVFMPSHGGNMAHVIQGHRAYFGHRKTIMPNKRKIVKLLLDEQSGGVNGRRLTEEEFEKAMMEMHHDSIGEPQLRTHKKGKDAIMYPVPDCMCKRNSL
ncbi:unnamed protein product [Closterium sp. Naga37s-1]|nr:unnamed protein product [Closterium sp. Naga37s-1]